MINSYATLTDYKAFVTARGQTVNPDTADDGSIKDLLENASRYLDGESNRQYFPTVETRVYDIPRDGFLWVDGDLLEVLTLTNGDGTTISSSNYYFHSPNLTPYYGITLKPSSNLQWQADSNGNEIQVISLMGVWGYCEKYSQRAWSIGGTLGAAITDTTTLAFTMSAGHTLVAGQVVKIGTEIYNIDSISTNTITPVARGDNGSTAATHLSGTTVYIWNPDVRATKAVLDQANIDYDLRFKPDNSQNGSQTATEIKTRGAARSMRDFIDLMKAV